MLVADQREIARGASWFSKAQLGQPCRRSGQSSATARDQLRGQLLGVEEVEAVGAVQPRIALGERFISRQRVIAADLGEREAAAVAVGQLRAAARGSSTMSGCDWL